jgi:hypothetical protein
MDASVQLEHPLRHHKIAAEEAAAAAKRTQKNWPLPLAALDWLLPVVSLGLIPISTRGKSSKTTEENRSTTEADNPKQLR